MTPDQQGEPMGFCNLCTPARRMPAAEILEHLREAHDFHEEPATWPDGELVIVDQTLTPEDFA